MTLKLLPSRPAKLATIVSPLSHRSVRTRAFWLFAGSGSATAGAAPNARDKARTVRMRRRHGMARPFVRDPTLTATEMRVKAPGRASTESGYPGGKRWCLTHVRVTFLPHRRYDAGARGSSARAARQP